MYQTETLKHINFKTLATLPQIYDNSLTEYEMMCRLAEKVNEIILSLNIVDEEIKSQVIEYCKTENLHNIVAEYLNKYQVNVKYPPMGIEPAVGNGVYNDTETIKQCINYAVKNGLAVFFPKGSYKIIDTIELINNGSVVLKAEGNAKIVNDKVLISGITPEKVSIINMEVTGTLTDTFPKSLILTGLKCPQMTLNSNYAHVERCDINTLNINSDYVGVFDCIIKNLQINGSYNTAYGKIENVVIKGGYNHITSNIEEIIINDKGVYNSVSTQYVKNTCYENFNINADNFNVNECINIDNGKNVDFTANNLNINAKNVLTGYESLEEITEKTKAVKANNSREEINKYKTVTAETIEENSNTKKLNAKNLFINSEKININKPINTYSEMFNSVTAFDGNGETIDLLVANSNTKKVSGFEGNTHTNTHFRYYVDGVNGNDENDGRTQAKAFKTLQKVFELINKGQSEIRAFIVSKGVYTVDVGNVFNGVAIHLTGKVDGVVVRFISDIDCIAFYNSHVNYQNITVECSYSDVDIVTDEPQRGIYYENTAVYFTLVNHAQTGSITFYGCYIYLEDLTAYTIECLATNGYIHELIIKCDKLGKKAIQVKHGSCINFYGALKAENLILNDTENSSCFIYVNGGVLLCRSACPSNFKESIGQYHWGIYAVNSIILMNVARLKSYSDSSTNGIFASGVQFLDISDYRYSSNYNFDEHGIKITTLDTDD